MNRKRIVVLVVALICAGGLAMAAATVSSPDSGESGTGQGVGSDADDSPSRPEKTDEQSAIQPPEWLQLVVLGLFVASMLYAAYLTLRRLNARSLAIAIVALMLVTLLVLGLAQTLDSSSGFDQTGKSPPRNDSGGTGGESNPGREATGSTEQETNVPPALLGMFGVIVLVLIATIYRFSGDDRDVDLPEAEPESEEGGGGVQAVGAAAGRAADDIAAESTTVENAVYEAWREMTDALEVENRRTTTPEEFAEIAVDAGMSPDDVRELTWLFEEVRYGDATPSERREQRAKAALRRIEEAYAADETEATDE